MIWWETARPVTLTVACDGASHRLRWRAGAVELADHPELDAELALVALGGAEPACVALHRLWHEAVVDGGFLAEWVDDTRLTDAWFSWLGMALERMRSEGFHEFLRSLPPARAQRMGEFLHRFPPRWIDRAAASVSQAVAERDGVVCEDAPGLLAGAVANRLRRAFVDAVGGRQLAVGAAALVPLRISVVPAPADRSGPAVVALADGALTGAGRGVDLAVEASWLHRVWAAGAAVVGGRLVLALDQMDGRGPEASATRAVARVVAWAETDPVVERRTVEARDGRWVPVGDAAGY